MVLFKVDHFQLFEVVVFIAFTAVTAAVLPLEVDRLSLELVVAQFGPLEP